MVYLGAAIDERTMEVKFQSMPERSHHTETPESITAEAETVDWKCYANYWSHCKVGCVGDCELVESLSAGTMHGPLN